MEAFKVRMALMEEFKKGKIDLTTLSGETFRAIKEFRGNKSKEIPNPTDKPYLDYLIALCKLERRVNFEYRLIKSELSEADTFTRVCSHYLSEMSKAVLDITSKIENAKEVQEICLGPKGIVILQLENSPIGRVYISRTSYLDTKIKGRANKVMTHPYLKALFSFL